MELSGIPAYSEVNARYALFFPPRTDKLRLRMKRITLTTRLLPVMLLLTIIFGSLGIFARKDDAEARRRRQAARHYYLVAAQYSATGHNAEAAELFKKAYNIDTTYSEAALQYGARRWGMPVDTLSTPEEKAISKRIAKKFLKEYPADLFPNLFLSNVMENGGEIDESVAVLENLNRQDPGNTDVLIHLSALYLDQRKFDKALDAINAYERIEGDGIELLIRKSGMMLAMGDTAAALRETDRYIAKYPADLSYPIFKGQLYNYINRPDSALKAFTYVESLEKPGFGGPVKLQLADYYRSINDSVSYDKKMYEALLSEDLDFITKNDVMAFYLQTLIVDNADRSRGDRLFEVLKEQYPHEPDLLALSARYNAAKKEYAKAIEDVGYAIDMDHTNPEYWEQAMIYSILNDNTSAVDSIYRRARLSLDKTPMSIYNLAGNNAILTEDYDRALSIYQLALDENFPGQEISRPADLQALGTFLTYQNIPDLISLYTGVGDVYYKMGDRQHSYINYDNALTLDPDNALTLNNYAYYIVEGNGQISDDDLKKADEMSLKAVTQIPDNPTYLDTRAWVLFRKKQFDDALELEQRAIELLDEDAEKEETAEYYHHLGDILFMINRPQEAVDAWKTALEATPDDELLKKKVKNRTFYYE